MRYLLTGVFLVWLSSMGLAQIKTGKALVTWDQNTESDLGGYQIYRGVSSGNYTKVVDVGLINEGEIVDLTAGITHYFVVTAYDRSGNESDFSNEVSLFLPISTTRDSIYVSDFDIDRLVGGRYEGQNGEFFIWGTGTGNDAGFSYLNPNQDELQFNFDIQMTGIGSCVDSVRTREFYIGDELYLIRTNLINYTTKVFSDSTIKFNFMDDCFKPEETPVSDANVNIYNLKAVFFEAIRSPRDYTFFSLRKED